jgi:hypothetical protein
MGGTGPANERKASTHSAARRSPLGSPADNITTKGFNGRQDSDFSTVVKVPLGLPNTQLDALSTFLKGHFGA